MYFFVFVIYLVFIILFVCLHLWESESGALFGVREDQSKPGTGICWVNTQPPFTLLLPY